eukprot:2628332-Heterocapsa_arctica.AAC.1
MIWVKAPKSKSLSLETGRTQRAPFPRSWPPDEGAQTPDCRSARKTPAPDLNRDSSYMDPAHFPAPGAHWESCKDCLAL